MDLGKKIILEDIKQRLKIINPNVIILSSTCDSAHSSMEIKCLKTECQHEWNATWNNLSKGRGCPKCANKRRGEALKLSKEEAISVFEKKGYFVTIAEYKNNMECYYAIDGSGYQYFISVASLSKNIHARKFSKSNPYSIHNLKLWLELNNSPYTLLSEEYLGNNSNNKLKLSCPLHGEFRMSWANLSQGYTCQTCVGRKHYCLEEVITELKEIAPNIEILSKEYISIDSKLICQCTIQGCDNIWKVTWNKLKLGRNCPKCARRKKSGANHYHYNPNLTDEERKTGGNVIVDGKSLIDDWRTSIFKRDKFTCVVCKDSSQSKLNAHHLNGYHWDIENRFNLLNGVTLCIHCHKAFHKEYGVKNNTKEQFEEFCVNH